MKIALLVADGSEEMESVIPFDVLTRAGIKCDVISVGKKELKLSRGFNIVAEKTVEEVDFNEYEGIIIPGGMPGATNISESKEAIFAIKDYLSKGKLVAAICASPAVVLAKNGLIRGRKVTCYPAANFIREIDASDNFYTGASVETDENLVTADGPLSATDFAVSVCRYLGEVPKF